MRKLWKPGTMLNPVPVVMVSCGNFDKGEKNIITVAWAGTINSDPAMVSISVRPSRYSYNLIKNNGEFVINLPTKELAFATDWCGVKSGRDEDKFKKMKLTAEKGSFTACPVIAECPVCIECKVKDIIPLGSHDMFLGEILGVSVDEKYMDETNRFAYESTNPICYSHGEYYTLGEKIGGFGYSVKRK